MKSTPTERFKMETESKIKRIVITKMPISTPKEDIAKIELTDSELHESISFKAKELESNNKEVFMIRNNVLVAEDGWYGAFFEDDLKPVKK